MTRPDLDAIEARAKDARDKHPGWLDVNAVLDDVDALVAELRRVLRVHKCREWGINAPCAVCGATQPDWERDFVARARMHRCIEWDANGNCTTCGKHMPDWEREFVDRYQVDAHQIRPELRPHAERLAKAAEECRERGCHQAALVIHVDNLDPELVEQLTAALDRDKVRRFA